MLFARYSCDNVSGSTVVSEFTKINSLPSAEIKSAICDWNCKTVTDEGAFCVGWHIIVAFEGVLIIWLTLSDHAVEDAFHVDADVWICVLIDCQSGRCMLDK